MRTTTYEIDTAGLRGQVLRIGIRWGDYVAASKAEGEELGLEDRATVVFGEVPG